MAVCPSCCRPITKHKDGRKSCKRHGPIKNIYRDIEEISDATKSPE